MTTLFHRKANRAAACHSLSSPVPTTARKRVRVVIGIVRHALQTDRVVESGIARVRIRAPRLASLKPVNAALRTSSLLNDENLLPANRRARAAPSIRGGFAERTHDPAKRLHGAVKRHVGARGFCKGGWRAVTRRHTVSLHRTQTSDTHYLVGFAQRRQRFGTEATIPLRSQPTRTKVFAGSLPSASRAVAAPSVGKAPAT